MDNSPKDFHKAKKYLTYLQAQFELGNEINLSNVQSYRNKLEGVIDQKETSKDDFNLNRKLNQEALI